MAKVLPSGSQKRAPQIWVSVTHSVWQCLTCKEKGRKQCQEPQSRRKEPDTEDAAGTERWLDKDKRLPLLQKVHRAQGSLHPPPPPLAPHHVLEWMKGFSAGSHPPTHRERQPGRSKWARVNRRTDWPEDQVFIGTSSPSSPTPRRAPRDPGSSCPEND